jgi:hypothetical protein
MDTHSMPCTHLRHKGMYVLSTPEEDGAASYDKYDATVFWCSRTQKTLGPDGRPAHADACRHGRDCCPGAE